MKKEYRRPQIKTRSVRPSTILAGSPPNLGVSNTTTDSQEAKPSIISWGDYGNGNNE